MKKRSLSSLVLLEIITLGFYELYWLYKTRNEIVSKFGIRIPSSWWLLLVEAVQIGCVLFTAYVVLYAIPANNRKIDNLVHPTPECFIEYADSSDSVKGGGQQTVNENCKNQVDEYSKEDNTVTLLWIVFGLYIVSFVLMGLILKRWYVPYAKAIAKVTKQKISGTYAMTLLLFVPPPFGMLIIQDTYNKL